MIFTENDMSEALKNMRFSREFVINNKNVMVIYQYIMKIIYMSWYKTNIFGQSQFYNERNFHLNL